MAAQILASRATASSRALRPAEEEAAEAAAAAEALEAAPPLPPLLPPPPPRARSYGVNENESWVSTLTYPDRPSHRPYLLRLEEDAHCHGVVRRQRPL